MYAQAIAQQPLHLPRLLASHAEILYDAAAHHGFAVSRPMREGGAEAMQTGMHLAFCRFAPMAACSPMPCCPGMRG